MKPAPVVLVDDPVANRLFDLERVLARRAPGPLVAVVVPVPAVLGATAEDGIAASVGDAALAVAAASATTAGAPVLLGRYDLRWLVERDAAASGLAVGAVVDALASRTPAPAVVVVFVSLATLPLVEALHADARTRPWLKLGITSARLDPDFTLAQKLEADRKLHYHEHTLSLERVLGRRLETMWRAHAGRPAAG